MHDDPVRIGILGTGHVAREFLAAIQQSARVRVVAIASRHYPTAEAFARTFGVDRVYPNYEALVLSQEVEAVYVALPNSLHAEWAINAATSSKHVLCEKPLGTSLAEVRCMANAARRNRIVLLEAFPYYFQPQMLELLRRIKLGEIGMVHIVQASMGFTVDDRCNIRFSSALGGGALLDAGSYAVSIARRAIGRCPISVDAVSIWNESGIDLATTATLHYSLGTTAQIVCGLAMGAARRAIIIGSDGVIDTEYSNHTSSSRPACFRLKRGRSWEAEFEDIAALPGNGFLFEAEAFAALIRTGGLAEADRFIDISIENAATLDAIKESALMRRQSNVASSPNESPKDAVPLSQSPW